MLAFCWAVQKSGWGGLMSPGKIKAPKPIWKISKCIWSVLRVSAPVLGLDTQNECPAFIKWFLCAKHCPFNFYHFLDFLRATL